MTTLLPTALAVSIMAGVTYVLVRALRLEQPWLQPWAVLRAAVQLGLLSVVLAGVITSPLWVAVFLLVMVVAATWTVMTRLHLAGRLVPFMLALLVVASAVPTGIALVVGAVDPAPRYVLAFAGIMIGNVMSVATLVGRQLTTAIVGERDEIEGWLALGAAPRFAASRTVRAAASTALVPATDQARTTGIVTLPGAFVGAIFAGASPLEAAAFQLVVLAGILTAGAVSVAAMSWRFGAPRLLPDAPSPLR